MKDFMRLLKFHVFTSFECAIPKFILITAVTPILILVTKNIPAPCGGFVGTVYRLFSGDVRVPGPEKDFLPIS